MQYNYVTLNLQKFHPESQRGPAVLVHQVAVNEDIAFSFLTSKRAGIAQTL
jgi:hypothetical protein